MMHQTQFKSNALHRIRPTGFAFAALGQRLIPTIENYFRKFDLSATIIRLAVFMESYYIQIDLYWEVGK